MAIKPQSAKAKGRNLQNWVAAKFGEILGVKSGTDDDALVQPRPMGHSGKDIIFRGEAAERMKLAIECKSGESFRLVDSIKQARANSDAETSWIIVHRRKAFRNPIVMMDWDTFEEMTKELLEDREFIEDF